MEEKDLPKFGHGFQPIVIQDNGCYESTPGEFKTIKLWKTYGLFTPLSSRVLCWIQMCLCHV